MARIQTVIETASCDLCATGATIATAHQVIVRIDLSRKAQSLPRLIDVCDTHNAELSAMSELIRKVGVILDRPEPILREKRWVCPQCGANLVRSYATQHIQTTHGIVIKQPEKCPDCGKASGGMTLHRKQVHGYDVLAEHVAKMGKGKK